MTLAYEQDLAIANTRNFLLALLDPRRTPRVPRAIRLEARALLKHYPQSGAPHAT